MAVITGLTITRKPGERVYVGSRLISIKIVEIDRNKVTLYIEAPPEVLVAREEILDIIFGKDSDHAEGS